MRKNLVLNKKEFIKWLESYYVSRREYHNLNIITKDCVVFGGFNRDMGGADHTFLLTKINFYTENGNVYIKSLETAHDDM